MNATSSMSLVLEDSSKKLVENATKLPVGDQLEFESVLNSSLGDFLQKSSTRTLSLLQKFVDFESKSRAAEKSSSSSKRKRLSATATPQSVQLRELDAEDIVEEYESSIVDFLDGTLERVDHFLDLHQGKLVEPQIKLNAVKEQQSRTPLSTSDDALRPQRQFSHLIDNSNNPWRPVIFEKPNAVVPLEDALLGAGLSECIPLHSSKECLSPSMKSHVQVSLGAAAASSVASLSSLSNSTSLLEADELAIAGCCHPYRPELLQLQYMPSQFQKRKEKLYDALDSTSCDWISEREQVIELAQLLESASEIAIDLEHHSMRTYQGFTCLMQISTRQRDFLVDTLALRSELYRLNSSFTNPRIVKVLHGADRDIEWLQRDFGLYIVNLFDTGQASRALELERFSLAHLLQKFCDVEADKQYQLADWRVRPLSEEMLKYAREDTHYLLYIYDRLHNMLLEKGGESLMRTVLDASRALCLKRYEKPMYHTFSHARLLDKFSIRLSELEMRVFELIYGWRDYMARIEDDGVTFILTHRQLTRIAQQQPTDIPQLRQACASSMSAVAEQHAAEIIRLVELALASPVDGAPPLSDQLPLDYRPVRVRALPASGNTTTITAVVTTIIATIVILTIAVKSRTGFCNSDSQAVYEVLPGQKWSSALQQSSKMSSCTSTFDDDNDNNDNGSAWMLMSSSSAAQHSRLAQQRDSAEAEITAPSDEVRAAKLLTLPAKLPAQCLLFVSAHSSAQTPAAESAAMRTCNAVKASFGRTLIEMYRAEQPRRAGNMSSLTPPVASAMSGKEDASAAQGVVEKVVEIEMPLQQTSTKISATRTPGSEQITSIADQFQIAAESRRNKNKRPALTIEPVDAESFLDALLPEVTAETQQHGSKKSKKRRK